jgi:hypothetical protein
VWHLLVRLRVLSVPALSLPLLLTRLCLFKQPFDRVPNADRKQLLLAFNRQAIVLGDAAFQQESSVYEESPAVFKALTRSVAVGWQ